MNQIKIGDRVVFVDLNGEVPFSTAYTIDGTFGDSLTVRDSCGERLPFTIRSNGKVKDFMTEQLAGFYSADPEHLAAADKMLKDSKDAVLKTILIYEEHTIFDIADRLTLEQLKTLAKWLTK